MNDSYCPDVPNTSCVTIFEHMRDDLSGIRASLDKHEAVIDSIIDERRARKEFWEAVNAQLVSSGIWGFVAALAYTVWYAFQVYISKH